tara:strand:+ start:759 stop:1628 length:870 start_codon:yes stop_codon:yes gene_type:complete
MNCTGILDVGGGRVQQDAYRILRIGSIACVVIVCDGHGDGGELISECVVNHICDLLSDMTVEVFLEKVCNNWETLSTSLFSSAHDAVCGIGSGGSTATLVVRVQNNAHIAYVGDSKAILVTKGGESVDLCRENHSPMSKEEYNRIRSCSSKLLFKYGGNVQEDIFDESGEFVEPDYIRTGASHKNVSGDWGCHVIAPSGSALAMTRALGDLAFSNFGVSHVPSTDICTIGEGESIVIASDGLWDNWVDDDVAKMVHGHVTLNEMVKKNEKMGIAHFGEARDNVCIVIIT